MPLKQPHQPIYPITDIDIIYNYLLTRSCINPSSLVYTSNVFRSKFINIKEIGMYLLYFFFVLQGPHCILIKGRPRSGKSTISREILRKMAWSPLHIGDIMIRIEE
jgi:hypothetical protein